MTSPHTAAQALRRAAHALDGNGRLTAAKTVRATAHSLDTVGTQIGASLREQSDPGLPAQQFDREGGRSGDHSDPTSDAACRPADRGHLDVWLAWSDGVARVVPLAAIVVRYAGVFGWADAVHRLEQQCGTIDRVVAAHHPSSSARPATSKGACLGGVTHFPIDDGSRCAIRKCGQPWPCRDGETAGRFAECVGRIDPVDNRCRICQLHGDSMVCRDCDEVKPRSSSRSGVCGACRKARERKGEA